MVPTATGASLGQNTGPPPEYNLDVCPLCGKPISEGTIVVLPARSGQPKQHFHHDCFRCARCNTALAGQTYRRDQPPVAASVGPEAEEDVNAPYVCGPCWAEHRAPRCAACAEPVTGTILGALDGSWHPECFTCAGCTTPLGGEQKFFRGPSNMPMCPQCI
mmetsp:Transcript_5798/g.16907  ORF Transcript_5798/g.16907 Transcript_5798/m.16907 type:complete len:161 (-) Transcript_5798:285-767(-)